MFDWCASHSLRAELQAWADQTIADWRQDYKFASHGEVEQHVVETFWAELHRLPQPEPLRRYWRGVLLRQLVAWGVLWPVSTGATVTHALRGVGGRNFGPLQTDRLWLARNGQLYAFSGWHEAVPGPSVTTYHRSTP